MWVVQRDKNRLAPCWVRGKERQGKENSQVFASMGHQELKRAAPCRHAQVSSTARTHRTLLFCNWSEDQRKPVERRVLREEGRISSIALQNSKSTHIQAWLRAVVKSRNALDRQDERIKKNAPVFCLAQIVWTFELPMNQHESALLYHRP